MYRYLILLFCCFVAGANPMAAQGQQPPQQQAQRQQQQIVLPVHPAGRNPQERARIDGLRIGTNMNTDDALPRSREFIRIDSTYYLGWLYEGVYKYNHANDFLGYRNAAASLERALNICERDYRYDLSKRSRELINYYQSVPRQQDYVQIVQYLNQCYQNTEEPQKSYALLRRALRWNFQIEFYEFYNQLAWITHRNRFYTGKDFSFLKNSIDENEALAGRYLDTSLRRIDFSKAYNEKIPLPATVYSDMKLGVYHYKSMLASYSFKVDSAMSYFDKMRNTTHFPHNNYATFRAICGDFREAESEYKLASGQDPADKRLQEWAYYSSIIDIYKGLPKTAELRMKEMIQANGSTPGFGWYNIALARALFYDGQISESERYGNKAADFKELHIGTTLGQSHYNFSIQLNKLMTKEAEWEQQRFEHKAWWYNPGVLGNMAGIIAERYLQEFLIINQFAQNPERAQVIYKLFSDESTISWDEVWFLIDDFNPRFFIKIFDESSRTDPRPAIRKYFRLFVAKLKMKDGDYKEAQQILTGILGDKDIDEQYEKLFVARVYEALAACAAEKDDDRSKSEWLYRLYQIYPQLIPFDGIKANMQLIVQGTPDEGVVKRLKDCNINWTSGEVVAPRAYLSFAVKEKTKIVTYSVLGADGVPIVKQQAFSYSDEKSGAVSLAYRLFGVGGLAARDEGDEDEKSVTMN